MIIIGYICVELKLLISVSKRSQPFVILISQTPLILLFALFSLSVILPGLVLMAHGFNLISHLVHSKLFKMVLNLLPISFLWCSSRFCFWSSSLLCITIHHSTQLSYFFLYCKSSFLCWWYSTQLLIFFSAPNFSTNKLLLQDTISKVSAWMSSNSLYLNHSKTEWLIGFPKQLSKMSNPLIRMSPEVSFFCFYCSQP